MLRGAEAPGAGDRAGDEPQQALQGRQRDSPAPGSQADVGAASYNRGGTTEAGVHDQVPCGPVRGGHPEHHDGVLRAQDAAPRLPGPSKPTRKRRGRLPARG